MTSEAVLKRRAYFRRRYREQRNWAIELLGGKCAHCGATERLEFDHSESKLKGTSVSSVIRGWSKERLAKFFKREKIQLLCVSCHLKKTMAKI